MDDEHDIRKGVHWQDEEAGTHAAPRLSRRDSIGSMSIRSLQSRREIDPAIALPIEFRTVSYTISESKQVQDIHDRHKAKDIATKGLSEEQVIRRVKEYGRNSPSPPKSTTLQTWAGYFFKGFGPVLLVGAILVLVSWKPLGQPPALANLVLAIVLFAVFFIQAIFNAFQDWSSSRVMSSIKSMLPEDCIVIRNSTQTSLPASELVPGDIVSIKAGNKLPADVRFLQVSSDAKLDRSILTGESVPLAASVDSTDNNYLETRCIGMQGTHCVSGTCLGLVVNRMAVTECTIGTHTITPDAAEDELCESETPATAGIITTGVSQARAIAALCNAAEFDASEVDVPIDQRRVFGDATDQAILRFSERLGSVRHIRQCWNKTYELAFNSKNKYMIRTFSLVRKDCLRDTLPEPEAESFGTGDTCSFFTNNAGDTRPFDDDVRATFEGMKNIYSSQGKRCIMLARKVVRQSDLPDAPNTSQFEETVLEQAKTGLTLVGLVAIVDPLRPEIRSVVRTLRTAGIRIFMVTGDFALTALAIAQDAGIVSRPSPLVHNVTALPREYDPAKASAASSNPRTSIVISGPELIGLNEYQWELLTEYEEIVFARTTPEQKLRIVREFQKSSVVAMTGDGVNDAPSLKAADVGIALGSGSDIAIEASDMVLLESFSSVVEAVQYGRVVFDNLKKVICYLLPAGSFAEFWPVITSVVFGLPQILSSFLMIIICCFTDCAAATVISYEKPEADVLLRKPRNVKKDRLVDWKLVFHAYGVIGILETVLSFFVSFWYLQRNGIPFTQLWFAFGKIPDGIDPDYYTEKLNIASSIYFVNLVVM
ncbi:hypothetical protein ONZ43_g1046 [Nemania bipapillata]|uniref:Uncharacterized protein n=1 Tax=Nemania bipapillata TaxID=110536 RepID=A0ACC2J642_9PEZI|nr:hypothetical protein ONZ43_g1046 [Nemania bipapillata]